MKTEKFFYPLMVVAALVTIYLALRKTGAPAPAPAYAPAQNNFPTIPPLQESVITPAGNSFTTNYITQSAPPAGSAAGTDPATIDNAVANALSPGSMPNYITTNQPGLSNYDTAPMIIDTEGSAGNGAACGCLDSGCGSTTRNPTALPDGSGLCGAGRVSMPASIASNFANRVAGYAVSNQDSVYEVWFPDNLLSTEYVRENAAS